MRPPTHAHSARLYARNAGDLFGIEHLVEIVSVYVSARCCPSVGHSLLTCWVGGRSCRYHESQFKVTIVLRMDLSDPMATVVPSLDAAVLRVLQGTSAPLTGAEIHRLSRRGSYAGVQKVLARLCDQGVVRRQSAGRVGQYKGNRSHLAWPAVELLAGISSSLVLQIRQEIAMWKVSPVSALLYGSAARSDGNVESDIDIWLLSNHLDPTMEEVWQDQAFALSVDIQDWTGNHASILESRVEELGAMVKQGVPILESLQRDGILLAGLGLRDLLRSVR